MLIGGCLVVPIVGQQVVAAAAFSDTTWTETSTETLAIAASDLQRLEVRTHNGSVKYTGKDDGRASAVATVTIKAGGDDADGAATALDAIELFAESNGDGTTKLGWRWRGGKGESSWRAVVSFDIEGPSDVKLSATTHNGGIESSGVTGDVAVQTHNGGIQVDSSGKFLQAQTHNGGIEVRFSGGAIELVSRNGELKADLSDGGAIKGSITTRNGAVEVIVGTDTSTTLNCITRRGGIKCNRELEGLKRTKRSVYGVLNGGEGMLNVTTRNGGIHIKTAE